MIRSVSGGMRYIAQKFVRIRRLRLMLYGYLQKGHSLLGSIFQGKHAPNSRFAL